jgi:hypothetical protein
MPEPAFGENQLARMSDQDKQKLDKLLLKRASTSAKQMELKRRDLAASTVLVETLLTRLMDEGLDPTSPEYQKLLNTSNLMAMFATTKALEYIADCVSYRQSFKLKGGRKGHARFTAADILDKIGHVLGSDDGVHDQIETLINMVNDIGKKQQAFLDEHGVYDPNKYESEDPGKAETEVDDSEAATDEELAEVEEKVKSKGKK